MDLSKFNEDTLFLAAMRSEVDAHRVKNALLKDKLTFLASEEEKHRKIIEDVYKEEFPYKELRIPEKSHVPLPESIINDEMMPISDVFLSSIFHTCNLGTA